MPSRSATNRLPRLPGRLRGNSLTTNSLLLMLSTAAMSAIGFVYWTIGTHLYRPDQVGAATAVLAALNLITSASLLGFEISIIRVLPGAADRSRLLGSCLGITSAVGLVAGGLFLFLQPLVSKDLGLVSTSRWAQVIFVSSVIISIYSYMIESTFIALRASRFVLSKNLIFSLAKLALLPLCTGLGAYGIYSSWIAGLLVALVVSLIVLKREFGLGPRPRLSLNPVRGMLTYSFANYVASFAEGLPIMLLPLLIVGMLGAVSNAHYYIAMMIANLLFIIPIGVTQSLFAEGSHEEGRIRSQTISATRLIGLLLIPASIVLWLVSPRILRIFGSSYESDGQTLLNLLILSAFVFAGNSVARTVLKLRYQSAPLVWVSLVGSAFIVGFAYLLRGMDLAGVGLAWILGQSLMLVLYSLSAWRGSRVVRRVSAHD